MSEPARRPARPASTICVVRDGPDGIEVVMCRRTPSARFMGGSWVFPGGAVDAIDATELAAAAVTGARADVAPHELAWRAAALRELAEEAGIWLTTTGATTALPRVAVDDEAYRAVVAAGTRFDGASLSYFANWITPAVLPIRFDTRFYAGLVVDEGIEPEPDGEELDLAQWVAPSEALERARSGAWPVPFPTRKTLEFLASFPSAEALVTHAASIEVSAVEPKLRVGEDGVEIVLPGEPGFDELPAVPDEAAAMLSRYRDEGEGRDPGIGGTIVNIESVLAPNPGWFTGPGTNTYLVAADGDVVIIDPGPEIPQHFEAVTAAASGHHVAGVLVTHTHPDHAPAANRLGVHFDVPVYGFGPGPEFEPTHLLGDGDVIAVGEARLAAVHTPGHTPDHLCFQVGRGLFTGDHIMGGSTVIIENASEYMRSLYKVADLGVETIYPGHGPVLENAGDVIAGYIAHRQIRESQIVASLRDGASTIGDLVREIYRDVDPALHRAATAQVIVQLRKLADEGRVSFTSGGAGLETPVAVSKETES